MANGAPRPAIAQNRPTSPFTPFPPRRAADATLVNGSGSTIPVLPSSSHAPTPMSVDITSNNTMRAGIGATAAPIETPSRAPAVTGQASEPNAATEMVKDDQSRPNGSSEAAAAEAAPPLQPPASSTSEAPTANVQTSPNHVPGPPKDSLVGPRADRTPLHGAFGQPPGLAAEVKVGNG